MIDNEYDHAIESLTSKIYVYILRQILDNIL